MPSIRNLAQVFDQGILLNSAELDDVTYKFGTAAVKFYGDRHSYVKSSEKFALGTQDWCFEMWVNVELSQPNTVFRLAQCSSDLPNEFGPGHISLRVSGGLAVVAYDYNQSTPLISSPENLVGAGWKHVAVSRAGSTWRLFVDGIVIGTSEWSGSIVGSNEWLIGGNAYSATGFSGWADDIRFTFGAARYTAGFTPPSAAHPDYDDSIGLAGPYDTYSANVELLLGFDGSDGSSTVTDLSSVPKTLTVSGSFALATANKKFGSSSLGNVATGTGGVTITPVTSLQMGSSNFTFECWVYKLDSTHCRVWNFNVFTGIANDEISLGIGSNFISFVVGSFNSSFSYTIKLNTWHHFALVRNGNSILLFLNGVQLDVTGTYSGTLPTQDRMVIGNISRNGSSLLPFIGFIDEFRVTKGVARYTSNFNVSRISIAVPLTQSGDALFASVKLLYAANFYVNPKVIVKNATLYYSPVLPIYPVRITNRSEETLFLRRVDYGGNGKVSGTVKIKGTPNVAVARRVRLIRDLDGVCVAETWSDPDTGAYEFLGFDPLERYTVLAYDYQQSFRAVVADNLTPEAYL